MTRAHLWSLRRVHPCAPSPHGASSGSAYKRRRGGAFSSRSLSAQKPRCFSRMHTWILDAGGRKAQGLFQVPGIGLGQVNLHAITVSKASCPDPRAEPSAGTTERSPRRQKESERKRSKAHSEVAKEPPRANSTLPMPLCSTDWETRRERPILWECLQ